MKLGRALGYADEAYDNLDDDLKEIKRLVKAKEASDSALAKFRENLQNLFKRQSEN